MAPENLVRIFIGNLLHCTEKLKIESLENGFVAVQGKQIISVGSSSFLNQHINKLKSEFEVQQIHLKKSQILIPGFIDTHIHAPQYPNSGLGYDKTLLDWLESYTFKLERNFRDLQFAKTVFNALIRKSLDHGTTTACYFGSLFFEANMVLVDSVIKHGQRALVGKVNMTQSPLNDYVETEDESLKNTVRFIENVDALQTDLVQPIITPRFILSTNIPHMKELAKIAKNNDLCIQTHISENVEEVRIVRETFGMSYAKAYDESDILTPKTILAHGVHLSNDELKLIAKRGASIAHCPGSNTCLKSGLCDVTKLLEYGIKVGLGSDVSGGPSPSIREVMKLALDTTVNIASMKDNHKPLTYTEVFYLATLGGAEVLSLDKKIGNFVVGKEFDALIVDLAVEDSYTDYFPQYMEYSPLENLQKFIYCGDDRNIVKVFVAGKEVKTRDKYLKI
ncbi:guanine deaminase isoform X1 [Euwallacea similis]|uniref:guanine deaminase isoform X1 n=1 Tax=Euwallacea similis TaxID=1736056 RepID=UPI00345068AD